MSISKIPSEPISSKEQQKIQIANQKDFKQDEIMYQNFGSQNPYLNKQNTSQIDFNTAGFGNLSNKYNFQKEEDDIISQMKNIQKSAPTPQSNIQIPVSSPQNPLSNVPTPMSNVPLPSPMNNQNIPNNQIPMNNNSPLIVPTPIITNNQPIISPNPMTPNNQPLIVPNPNGQITPMNPITPTAQNNVPLPVNIQGVVATGNSNQNNPNQVPIKVNTVPIHPNPNIQITPTPINTAPVIVPQQNQQTPLVYNGNRLDPMKSFSQQKKGCAAYTAPPVLTVSQKVERPKDAIIQKYSEGADMNYPKRRQMEDSHCEKDPLYKYTGKDGKEHTVAMYALFDGHGGRYAALKAADIVANHCKTNLIDRNFDTSEVMRLKRESDKLQMKISALLDTDPNKAIKNNELTEKHEEVKKAKEELTALFTEIMTKVMQDMDKIIIGDRVDESGCCALVCIIDVCEDEKVVCMANVGDSCGNIISQNDKGIFEGAIEMSVEHRAYKMNQEEMDRILNLGGMIFNDRVNGTLAVSRALGDVTLKPYVSNEPFCKIELIDNNRHKLIVLGCDGLWDYVTSTTICEYLQQYLEEQIPFDEYGSKLITQSKRNKSTDNISVVVLGLNELIPYMKPEVIPKKE